MILIDVDGVTMTRPDRALFRDVRFTLSSGDRLGVLGINGVGKSTLLNVVVGEIEPEAGTVRRGRDVRIASLDQRPTFGAETVRAAVGEGWEAESILDRLGMGQELDSRLDELSGGQRKRVALARALVADVDLLVLDEPTNHLDIEAIEWLEQRLRAHKGGLVIVTHDRQLLDRVTNRVLELDRSGWHLTDGGYQKHLELAAEREEKAIRDEASRRILARQELAWISRGARARRRKPKSRIAEAKAVMQAPEKDTSVRREQLALDSFGASRLGDRVIDLTDVSFSYDGTTAAVEGVSLSVEPGARLGIIGPNGAGKSTLLDLMARRTEPLTGEVEWGSTVRLGYFDQVGSELDPALRVRETLTGDDGQLTVEQSRLLERFWFDRDAQQAMVATLSGGERRRLELLMVLSEAPNVLLLDEPTNDLDLDTLRALEGFLDDWPGALVAVSHDRVFLERTVERVIAVEDGAARELSGGDAVWQRAKKPEAASASGSARQGSAEPPKPKRRSPSTLRRLISAVDERIDALRASIEEATNQLTTTTDHTELAAIGERLAAAEHDLEAAEEEWLELSGELED